MPNENLKLLVDKYEEFEKSVLRDFQEMAKQSNQGFVNGNDVNDYICLTNFMRWLKYNTTTICK